MRIVSLVPSITEALCMLGLEDSLVGITDYCLHLAPIVCEKHCVDGTENLRLREVIGARPDLVIVNTDENRRQTFDQLQAAGLNVLVTQADSLGEVEQTWTHLGEATGTAPAARQNREAIAVARAHNREVLRGVEPLPAPVAIGETPGWQAVTEPTWDRCDSSAYSHYSAVFIARSARKDTFCNYFAVSRSNTVKANCVNYDSDLRSGTLLAGRTDPEAQEGAGLRMKCEEPMVRDEAQMIAAILAGNTELYHELIRPYELAVYRMALSYMKNESDAEDAAQEAFLKAFHKLSAFRGQSKFSTWLISITLNEARRRLRHHRTLRFESLDEPLDEGGHVSPAILLDWREIPSDVLERSEVRELLQAAINHLSPIYRQVLLLRDVEELSIEETSTVLEISLSSVKVRLHRARMMLQKELAPKLKSLNPKRRWFQWS